MVLLLVCKIYDSEQDICVLLASCSSMRYYTCFQMDKPLVNRLDSEEKAKHTLQNKLFDLLSKLNHWRLILLLLK